MACQLFRTDGKVEKVLAPNEKPSLLYSEILTVVKKEGSKKFIDSIPYLRDRLEDGTLLNESSEEIAVGIWSIAYSPEYQAFFNNLNKKLNVFADENMLSTILRNLISNALKYTHKGGIINIFANVRDYNNKKFIVIGVQDNGVGIPEDKKGKIFNIEDNYTTNGTEKEKGTGLGLILCKEFVEKHEGKIWCESKENEGSTFFFSLPVVKK